MMKHITLSIMISIAVASLVHGQKKLVADDSPRITAEVKEFVREDTNDWIIFQVVVRFELKNTLNRRLFLLNDDFDIYGLEVFREAKGTGEFESILHYQQPPSHSGNAKWSELGEEIIGSGTKSKFLVSLNPNDSMFFERQYSFGFRAQGKTRYDRNLSWNEVKNEKKLFLQFEVNVWESEIRTKRISNKEFPEKINTKIKNQGVLWFKNITSQWIPLHLELAVVKISEK